jgi:hypothetical protein
MEGTVLTQLKISVTNRFAWHSQGPQSPPRSSSTCSIHEAKEMRFTRLAVDLNFRSLLWGRGELANAER